MLQFEKELKDIPGSACFSLLPRYDDALFLQSMNHYL